MPKLNKKRCTILFEMESSEETDFGKILHDNDFLVMTIEQTIRARVRTVSVNFDQAQSDAERMTPEDWSDLMLDKIYRERDNGASLDEYLDYAKEMYKAIAGYPELSDESIDETSSSESTKESEDEYVKVPGPRSGKRYCNHCGDRYSWDNMEFCDKCGIPVCYRCLSHYKNCKTSKHEYPTYCGGEFS